MKVLVLGYQGMLAQELRPCLTQAGCTVVGRGGQMLTSRKHPASDGCWPMSSLTFSSTLLQTRRLIKRSRSPMSPLRSTGMALAMWPQRASTLACR
jgi:hypothetical protein